MLVYYNRNSIVIESIRDFHRTGQEAQVPTRGRKHSAATKFLMAQVAREFGKKKDELGARKAATELNVSLASFYNYVNGTDLPRIEVLKEAKEKWKINWQMIDPSQIMLTRNLATAEQLLLPFLHSVREDDVEIVAIGPKRSNILQVTLNIRFSA
jgi:hypothetical protein